MKPYYFFLWVMLVPFILSCKKNSSNPSFSADEKRLLGHWDLKKKVVEVPGQPAVEDTINSPVNCFIDFKDFASPLRDQNSPVYSTAKMVQDNKDCSWLANAWKIDNAGKLILASLDTVYADILIVDKDTLAFKAPSVDDPHILITYEFL